MSVGVFGLCEIYEKATYLRCCRSYLPLNALGVMNFGNAQVIRGLQVKPGARVSTKVASQPHSCVCRDPTPLARKIIDARRWDIQSLSQSVRS
jgi:hypothetical protein